MPWYPTEHGFDVLIPSDAEGDKYHSKQKCPKCGREFSTATGLMGHLDNYHFKEGQGDVTTEHTRTKRPQNAP